MRGSRAAYRGGVPDKRQTSKQKRAARNRAQREALAARRENAATPARTPVTTGSRTGGSTTSASGSSRAAATAVAAPSDPRPPGLAAYRRENRRPGDFAVISAVLLALVGLALSLQASVTVDDRGEALPLKFGGVALDARSIITGEDVGTKENIISVYGFPIVAMMLVPVLVVIAVMVLNFRRADQRSRLLTFGMVAVAAVVFLAGPNGIYFLGALVALLVGSFQVRKVEAPSRDAQMAARREARANRGRRGAIDVDEVEADDEPEDEVDEAEAPARPTRARRSWAARRATTADAEVADAEAVDANGADEPEVIDAEVIDAEVVDEDAAPEPAEATARPSDDDILAELEEELRRESEADDGDDGPPTRR